jgi:hypothetical protein
VNAGLLLLRREPYSFFRYEYRVAVICMQALDESCEVEVCLLEGGNSKFGGEWRCMHRKLAN